MLYVVFNRRSCSHRAQRKKKHFYNSFYHFYYAHNNNAIVGMHAVRSIRYENTTLDLFITFSINYF